ncbi:hypothetical protein D9M72_198620 [compost metagenome]
MMDIGVARPSAHGHAMISTATALIRPNTQLGSGPKSPHATKVSTAMPMTPRTKTPATLSAIRCIGAFDRCACATIWTIWDSTVWEPTFSDRMTRLPDVFIVAPMTRSPTRLVVGMGSPVIIDSSTALEPSVTTPSTGTFSPGRTRSRSPTWTWVSGTSSSAPSGPIRLAVLGASPSSDLMAAEVWERALSSSN